MIPVKEKMGGIKEGTGGFDQRHDQPCAWVNNSLDGCAGLKVCHCVWRHPLKAALPDCIHIWWGGDGLRFIKIRRGGRRLWVVEVDGAGGHNVTLTPEGRLFPSPWILKGLGQILVRLSRLMIEKKGKWWLLQSKNASSCTYSV